MDAASSPKQVFIITLYIFMTELGFLRYPTSPHTSKKGGRYWVKWL